ncbi:cytochrome b [Blastomonas sp.]|uniref:cytochrome b n=1 Tax=Blastomonas sp. TaxID=1909299 RepID=UPI002635184F|nr:cytochrome b [Blastomonas sp.]MDM7955557.1 cytochrome b [Blastomonas sp.]
MATAQRVTRYSAVSITLHWLMLALIVGVFAAMELREYFPKGTPTREGFKSWHYSLGLTVFALVWVRIAARALTRAPAPTGGPAWRTLPARAVHIALYALMLAMPLAGWALLNAEGSAALFYGIGLPALIGENAGLASQIKWAHQWGGDIAFWLICAHAAASLFHHYWLKDGLLFRMMPAPR